MSHTIHIHGVAKFLQMTFPNSPFKVAEDAIAIFIRYTANKPGAPEKEALREILCEKFPGVLFKIPTLIDRSRQ